MGQMVSAELPSAARGHSLASGSLSGTAMASEVMNNPNYSAFP